MDELQEHRKKMIEEEKKISEIRMARAIRQISISQNRKRIDDTILQSKIEELEEEIYVISLDSNGEIEAEKKKE